MFKKWNRGSSQHKLTDNFEKAEDKMRIKLTDLRTLESIVTYTSNRRVNRDVRFSLKKQKKVKKNEY